MEKLSPVPRPLTVGIVALAFAISLPQSLRSAPPGSEKSDRAEKSTEEDFFKALGLQKKDLNSKVPYTAPVKDKEKKGGKPAGPAFAPPVVVPDNSIPLPGGGLPPGEEPAGQVLPGNVPPAGNVPPVGGLPEAAGQPAAAPAVQVQTRSQRLLKAEDIVTDVFQEFSSDRISLVEAVRMTLASNPNVELSLEDVRVAEASLKRITGVFDAHVGFNANYDNRVQELSDKDKEKELARYRVLRELHNTSTTLLKRLELIRTGQAGISAFNFEGTAFEDPDSQLNNLDDDPDVRAVDAAQFQQEQNRDALTKLLNDQLTALNVPQSVIDQSEERVRRIILGQKRIFELLRDQSFDALRNQPPWLVTRTQTYKFDIFARKKFRGGATVDVYGNLDGKETNGGTRGGDPRETRSAFGAKLTINVMKLGIADPATAQEAATKEQLRASQAVAQAQIAKEVLNTVQAYWRLAAAQERLLRLVQAELDTMVVAETASQMIKLKLLPETDVQQARARTLQAMADRFAGEVELITAQQALAVAIGINPEKAIVAPLAYDGLGDRIREDSIRGVNFGKLYSHALSSHPQLVSFLYLGNANRILVESAREGLRPDLELFAGGEFTGLNYGTGWDGYFNSWGSRQNGLSTYFGASFDWPVANNEREGALLDAQAQYAKTRLREDAARREFATQIASSRQRMLISARRLSKLSEAIEALEKAADAEREKLRFKTSTILDMLTSEQTLTQARLAEVSARQDQALSLAQLRYSTFTILPPHTYEELARNPAGFRLSKDYFTTLPTTEVQLRSQERTMNSWNDEPYVVTGPISPKAKELRSEEPRPKRPLPLLERARR